MCIEDIILKCLEAADEVLSLVFGAGTLLIEERVA